MFEELLDIPEGAGQFEALEALSSLREDVAAAKACCAQKEEELQHLREQTAELVAAQLADAGADEDYVQAAKAMWLQAPHSVSQAIGIEVLRGASPYKTSTSDDLVEAERGCNQYKHKPGCPEADENYSGEIKRNSGKRIVSHKIEKSFFFPTEDDARRFNIAKDTFLEELDPDGYLPETNYRNKKRYVVFGNLFIRNKESKGKMFTNLSDEDYRDLWNAENEVAGAYLDFNEQRTPDNLEAILKREREYDKVRLKLEKKYFKDKR